MKLPQYINEILLILCSIIFLFLLFTFPIVIMGNSNKHSSSIYFTVSENKIY